MEYGIILKRARLIIYQSWNLFIKNMYEKEKQELISMQKDDRENQVTPGFSKNAMIVGIVVAVVVPIIVSVATFGWGLYFIYSPFVYVAALFEEYILNIDPVSDLGGIIKWLGGIIIGTVIYYSLTYYCARYFFKKKSGK